MKTSAPGGRRRAKKPGTRRPHHRPDLPEADRIAAWLKQVRFKRRLLGGLDEADVWRRIGELNELYAALSLRERARYDALLQRPPAGEESVQAEPGSEQGVDGHA